LRRQLQSRNLGRPGKPLAKICASEIYYYYFFVFFLINDAAGWLLLAAASQK
jgi:hypothetical protein